MILISGTVSGRWKRRRRGCSLIWKEALKEGRKKDWLIDLVETKQLFNRVYTHSNPPDWWRITGQGFTESKLSNCDTSRFYSTSVNPRGVFLVYSLQPIWLILWSLTRARFDHGLHGERRRQGGRRKIKDDRQKPPGRWREGCEGGEAAPAR